MTSTNVTQSGKKDDRKFIDPVDLHAHVGKWIHLPEVDETAPVRLEFAASRPNPEQTIMVMVWLGDRTVSFGVDVAGLVRLATDDEVADAARVTRRNGLVKQLRELASLLAKNPGLPVRDGMGPSLTLHSRLSPEELEKVAGLLSLPVEREYGRTMGVTWSGSGDRYEGLTVTWQAQYPACPWTLVSDAETGATVWRENLDGGPGCKFEAGHDGDHKAPPAPVKP